MNQVAVRLVYACVGGEVSVWRQVPPPPSPNLPYLGGRGELGRLGRLGTLLWVGWVGWVPLLYLPLGLTRCPCPPPPPPLCRLAAPCASWTWRR